MDRLLNRIQRVRPVAFCSRDFSLLPTNLQVFANFWRKKCYNPLSSTVLSRFIFARLFSFLHVENEVKRTPLRGCCWYARSRNWWIKESPKEEFSAAFQKLHDHEKTYVYAKGAYFEFKKGICLLHVSSIFKKISPKNFGPRCVCSTKVTLTGQLDITPCTKHQLS